MVLRYFISVYWLWKHIPIGWLHILFNISKYQHPNLNLYKMAPHWHSPALTQMAALFDKTIGKVWRTEPRTKKKKQKSKKKSKKQKKHWNEIQKPSAWYALGLKIHMTGASTNPKKLTLTKKKRLELYEWLCLM